MGNTRYTEEFRAEAVKQVLERGFAVAEVAGRIGLSKHTLYDWVQKAKKLARVDSQPVGEKNESAEIRRLKAELRRVAEERDILKRPPRTFPRGEGKVRVHAGSRTRVSP